MKERRMFEENITAQPESRKVEGYAVVFNSESNDLGGFKEVIEPTALEGVVAISDVLCLLNHNEDKGVLAKIIDSVDVQEDDLIIEVGPGQGALTKFLKLFKANLRFLIISVNWFGLPFDGINLLIPREVVEE